MRVRVHADGGNIRLEGETTADFDGGSFRTEDVRVEPAEGCEGCGGRDCIRARGTLVTTYSVTTTVTLPSVSDYPDLTPCQRRRVQDAIDDVLRPHEQEHVRAFRQYEGTTRRQFDLTLCRAEFDGTIREMVEAEETSRRAAAQAASDALDPFHFDVDLDCEDTSEEEPSEDTSGGPPSPSAAEGEPAGAEGHAEEVEKEPAAEPVEEGTGGASDERSEQAPAPPPPWMAPGPPGSRRTWPP